MRRLAFFEIIVAFRFMREGLMQTLLIVLGVGLGAGVIIFMSALLAGLQSNVVRRTLNFQAPIVVLPPDQVARHSSDRAVATRHCDQVRAAFQRRCPARTGQRVVTDLVARCRDQALQLGAVGLVVVARGRAVEERDAHRAELRRPGGVR